MSTLSNQNLMGRLVYVREVSLGQCAQGISMTELTHYRTVNLNRDSTLLVAVAASAAAAAAPVAWEVVMAAVAAATAAVAVAMIDSSTCPMLVPFLFSPGRQHN